MQGRIKWDQIDAMISEWMADADADCEYKLQLDIKQQFKFDNRTQINFINIGSKTNDTMNKFKLISELGNGSFGKVELAQHMATGDHVAIKIISKQKIKTKQDMLMVNKQITVFKSVCHQNIIKLYQIIEDDCNLYLVMEYAENGDLLAFIKNNGTVTEHMALMFMKQLVEAVRFLHLQKSIAHRDIKLANILLTSKNNCIKLGDFGLSNFYDRKNSFLKTSCGSPCYSAPQILRGSKYDPLSADIWSLGVVFYSMIQGCLPFYDDNLKQMYRQVIKGKYCQHEKASYQIKVLIRKILEVNPQIRISIQQLMTEINILLQKQKNNKIGIQVPKLTSQSSEYIDNIKKQKIIKILAMHGYSQQQVRFTMQYRSNMKKAKKYNDLNTFIQLLERKTFNKISTILSELNQYAKQSQLSVKVSPVLCKKQLKRTCSSFTKDSYKESTPEIKIVGKARFSRNSGRNPRLNKLVQSQKRQIQRKQSEKENKNGPIDQCIFGRKKSQLSMQTDFNLSSISRDVKKEYSSLLNSINRQNLGYIKLNKQTSTSINKQTCPQSMQPLSKLISMKKPKEKVLTLSLNNRSQAPNPNMTKGSARVGKLSQQTINYSVDVRNQNKTEASASTAVGSKRKRNFRQDSRQEEIAKTSRDHVQNEEQIPRGIQTTRQSYSKQQKIGQARLKQNKSARKPSFNKSQIQQKQKMGQEMPIYDKPFNIMHTYNGAVNQKKLQCCIRSLCQNNKQSNKIGKYRYRLVGGQDKGQDVEIQIQIMRIKAFSKLKFIRIQPHNAGTLHQLKHLLSQS